MSSGRDIVLAVFVFPALWLALAGCSLHRPMTAEPPVGLPGRYAESMHAGMPLERWWLKFGDERLNALMEEAFAKNLDIAAAVARVKQMAALRRSAGASRLPYLRADAQASREKTPGFLGDSEGNGYRLSVTAGFEIDLWDRLGALSRAADLEAEATREDVMALYLGLSADVADFYYVVAEQRLQLSILDRTVSLLEEMLEMVEHRYREGIASALDVYGARQELTAAMARREGIAAGLASAEHTLAFLLGRYPGDIPVGEMVILPDTVDAFPEGIPSGLLARRPDVMSALLRVKASDERIAAAIADKFPAVNLLGSYGRSRTAFSTGDIVGIFWQVVTGITQTLFDGGRKEAGVDRARAVFEERLALYHKKVLAAFREVEDALARNRTTERRIAHLQKQVEAAEAALNITRGMYREGLAGYLQVLSAEVRLLDARGRLTAARRQLISDRISLARALGGKWMAQEMDKRLLNDRGEEK